ncbi:2-hydroxyacid dehydrogenase [Pseudoroseomonas globiformis]|uniref:2-hydroxyacid dehydrogenase n=1 Tax=Teichococcus globiformis TaxID=2307229 RepID=A0ABV7FWL9_9PROT
MSESKPGLLMLAPYPPADTEALERDYTLHRLWEAPDAAAYLAEHGGRIRGLATTGVHGASASLIAALPALEIISCFGVGVDAIDFPAARARNIAVTNTPEVLTDDVADMGMALLLATARRIPEGDALVRGGLWTTTRLPLTTRVTGKRIGIVGLGRIGSAVAQRAAGFGMEIAYTDRAPIEGTRHTFHPDAVSLAGSVDFLMLCAAGGESTRGMIGRAVLDALGPRGMLINICRGSVVDEPELLAALREKRIAAAGLDVFLNEPNIDPGFLTLNNVVLQPHHASGTVETRAAMGELVRGNLAAHFAGRALPTPVV